MYAISVPPLVRALNNLAGIMKKGAAHAEARKIDPLVLTGSRLFPDMYPLTRQVHIATDVAKACAARLAGVEVPRYDDVETSFPELLARVDKTIVFLNGFSAAQIDGSEDSDIQFKVGGNPMRMRGLSYVLGYVKPNVYFHIATAYNILRHNGVELGKRDFLGEP
jgi:hypothetical protein